MTATPRQLVLDWPHAPSFAREDFLEAAGNSQALKTILAWPDWPTRTLMLIGPSGAGKSHLATIWARQANARAVDAASLTRDALGELAEAKALLIEDADRSGADEAALFHLVNLARERGVDALITARAPPDAWGLKTADLLSRLFNDRQLAVDPALIGYVALRIERSLDAARALVAALDREALARGGPVTRAMAARLLRDEDQQAP